MRKRGAVRKKQKLNHKKEEQWAHAYNAKKLSVAINYTFALVDLRTSSNLVKVVKIMIAESKLFGRT